MVPSGPSLQADSLGPPFFGALLRITWQHMRSQMLDAVREAGFTDFQEAHFAVFSYPLPDGIRPSELARQRRMSRQAINYLLTQLQELGYVERRVPDGGDRRHVYLSPRGRQVAEAIFGCLRRLHAEWSDTVGQERFEIFLDVLKLLSAASGQAGSTRP
jgi:DNA-binding MarR family transcriptional regulator